jgi:predicted dehydrogenase
MSFRLGLVGLCTSHPDSWTPIIRKMVEDGVADVKLTAAWDSGETRPEGFAKEFCKKFEIPRPVEKLEDMLDQVDGVIVHTTNWDRHLEQAEPFVQAGKSVLLDKPIVGNLKDANRLLDWAKQGMRITGGSSLRFPCEVREFLAVPAEERGEIYHAYAGCGTDEFNYGIHAYSLLSAALGPGIRSVRYLGSSRQKHLQVSWSDGKVGLLTVGKGIWVPFHITIVTTKKVAQITVDNSKIYRSMLEVQLPYLIGKEQAPPFPMEVLLEPELAAMAARVSWMNNGQEVFLSDLRQDDPGYDGVQFAVEYRRARLAAR